MATKKQDNKAWDEFVAWCQKRGVSAVPANPWTLAAYARWCEPDRSHADIAKAFSDIAGDVGDIAWRFRFWGGDVAGDVQGAW